MKIILVRSRLFGENDGTIQGRIPINWGDGDYPKSVLVPAVYTVEGATQWTSTDDGNALYAMQLEVFRDFGT